MSRLRRFASLLLLPLVFVALHLLDGCENVKVNWPEVPKISVTTGNGGSSSGTNSGWSHDVGEAGTLAPTPAHHCTLPQHHDEYAGFSIGQPAGWLVGTGTGTIMVEKDQKGLTGALVYPARVRKADVPADRFADYFAGGLGRSIAQRGGTFQLANKVTDGHIARADATATVGGVKLRGPLEVVSQPGFVTLSLYWAPEETFAAEEPTLKQVVGCFHRETVVTARHPPPPPSTASGQHGGSSLPLAPAVAEPSAPSAGLEPFQTKFFVGKMPHGWKVKDEGPNGIDLVSPDQSAGFGYGWVQGSRAVPSQAVRQAVAQYYPDARVVWQGPLRGPGPGWVGYGVEFESDRAHGYWQGFRNSSIYVGTNVAVAKARWVAEKKLLSEAANSVTMNQTAVNTVNAQIRAQMALIPKPSPPAHAASASTSSSGISDWQHDQDVKDRIAQNWSDAILDQERAVSPTTGEEYIVPTSAWNPSGPQGAGYYRATPGGGAELLETPPAPSE